jgi:hypothetical protein
VQKTSLLCHLGQKTILDNFGTILGQFWDNFGTIFGQFWVNFGTILGQFWDNFDQFRTFWIILNIFLKKQICNEIVLV